MKGGWIGVDLDGTLAVDEGLPWEDMEHTIGPPVPAMLARVKAWLEEGREVRILTARVGRPRLTNSQQRKLIETWCNEHVGRALPVTDCKDYRMAEIWDDRAVQVVKNTGERVGDVERTSNECPECAGTGCYEEYETLPCDKCDGTGRLTLTGGG